jgi:hypothetical protein
VTERLTGHASDVHTWSRTTEFDEFVQLCGCGQAHLNLLTDPDSLSTAQRGGRMGPATLSEIAVDADLAMDCGESIQSTLPAADQADLTNVDDQLVQAYQGVLDADQAFVAADEAGDLSSGQGLLPADLGVIDADFAVLPADFNAVFADAGAEFANLFDISAFLP